jgi:manganese/zinc/iron transport system substrate-binding protein
MGLTALLTTLLTAFLTTGLAQTSAPPSKLEKLTARTSTGPINIVTTTNFITDLVEQIGGNTVKVTGLMGPGVDPHLYKATAGDVRTLQRAEIVFYGGLDLEGKMVELLDRIPRAITVTERIPREQLRKPTDFMPSSMQVDPHVWFNVKLWSQTISVVRDALSKVDPVNANQYATRATAYSKRLDQLESLVRRETARIPKAQRVLVTAHDAFGYFGDAYGFEVRGVQGMSTVSEAGARDVQALAEFLVSRKIKAVFIETSVPKRTIEAVVAAAQAKGWSVRVGGSLFSDAAGKRGTPEGTYVGMVEANVKTIVTALLGE